MGLSAEWDQSQEAAGCSAAQELQSTPFALPPCANSLAPQEGPSASSPLGHFFFYKILFIPTSQLRNQATPDPQGARSAHPQLGGSIPLCPSWPEAPHSVIESPEPDLNPKLCVSVKYRGCLGIRVGCPAPRFFPRAAMSQGQAWGLMGDGEPPFLPLVSQCSPILPPSSILPKPQQLGRARMDHVCPTIRPAGQWAAEARETWPGDSPGA